MTVEEGLDLEDAHFDGETLYGISEDVFKCYGSQVVEVLLTVMEEFGRAAGIVTALRSFY